MCIRDSQRIQGDDSRFAVLPDQCGFVGTVEDQKGFIHQAGAEMLFQKGEHLSLIHISQAKMPEIRRKL